MSKFDHHLSKKYVKEENNNDLLEDQRIKEYLDAVIEAKGKIKTLLYTDAPRNFYDFYVANDLATDYQPVSLDGARAYGTSVLCNDISIWRIVQTYSNHVLIVGTGGLGKSMMMRHLLLDSAKKYSKTGLVPVFVTLKSFCEENVEFLDLVYDSISQFSDISKDEILQLVKEGKMIFLLDGYDEINTNIVPRFMKLFEKFSHKYSNNIFVMSSRPNDSFISLSSFVKLSIVPFSLKKSVRLIEKLEFRPDEPEIKGKFIKLLNDELYEKHYSFASNPLLLTIMLMTFQNYVC